MKKEILMIKNGRYVPWDGSDVSSVLIKETLTLAELKENFPGAYDLLEKSPSEDKVEKCEMCEAPNPKHRDYCIYKNPIHPTPKPKRIERLEIIRESIEREKAMAAPGYTPLPQNWIVVEDKINELIDAVEELRKVIF